MKKFFALLVAAALICALTIGVVSCDFGSKSNGKPFDPATSSTQEFYEYIMERLASGDGQKAGFGYADGEVRYSYYEYYDWNEEDQELECHMSFDPETNEVLVFDDDGLCVELSDYSVEDMRWGKWYADWLYFHGAYKEQEDLLASIERMGASIPADRAAELVYYFYISSAIWQDQDYGVLCSLDTILYLDLVKLEKSDHILKNFEKLTDNSADENEYPASYYENTYKFVLNEETAANFDASKYELDEDVFQDPAVRYLDVVGFNSWWRGGLLDDIESLREDIEELIYFVFDENNELCQIIFYISNDGRINAINF